MKTVYSTGLGTIFRQVVWILQAAKFYLNALRWDDDKIQIYRDLGHLPDRSK